MPHWDLLQCARGGEMEETSRCPDPAPLAQSICCIRASPHRTKTIRCSASLSLETVAVNLLQNTLSILYLMISRMSGHLDKLQREVSRLSDTSGGATYSTVSVDATTPSSSSCSTGALVHSASARRGYWPTYLVSTQTSLW